MFKPLVVWFSNTKFYSWLLYHVIPYIRFSMYYTRIRGNLYHELYKHLQPGDYILTKDKKKLTTLLIGGEWTHAAFCVGKRDQGAAYEVVEMTHRDFTKSDFFDLCKEADDICIMRCVAFDAPYIEAMIKKHYEFVNAKYDVTFEMGVAFLYCSELVYQLDFERRLKVNLEDLAGLGRQYISPTGLFHCQNAQTVISTIGRE